MSLVEHLLVAIIPAFVFVLIRDQTLPTRRLMFVLFLGSLFPDFVDKPLAHQWFLLPHGRAFAHSPLVAIPLSLGILLFVHRTGDMREGVAFVYAYVSHIVIDFWWLTEYPAENHLQYLLWPLLPAPSRPQVPRWAGPNSIYVTLWTALSITVLTVTGFLLVKEIRK